MTDRYTKTILTIIAAALLANLAQQAIPRATADEQRVAKVAICNETGESCANIGTISAGPNKGTRVLMVIDPTGDSDR